MSTKTKNKQVSRIKKKNANFCRDICIINKKLRWKQGKKGKYILKSKTNYSGST